MNYLAVFDIESVLVDGEFLPALASLLGKKEEIEKITLEGISGKIDWNEGLIKRINLLKGAEYEKCVRIAESLPLMKGSKELIERIKKIGFTTIAISGGPSILAERVKKELNIDYQFSNELIFSNGKLEGIRINVSSNKLEVLKRFIESRNLKFDEIFVVIDGANDLSLFEVASLKIAFNAQKIVEEKADVVIREKDLSKLIPIFENVRIKV